MKYPIGIQSFEKIRLGEYTYVDKTALIHQLVNTSNYYFLSRPRRFGKSLLISTLEAYFNGQQELFKGLEMERLEKEWTKYPVLHLDLNTSKYDEKNSLINVLNDTLRIPDGGDEIRKGQCVQRPEQLDRPLHGPTVPDALRNDRQRDTHLF